MGSEPFIPLDERQRDWPFPAAVLALLAGSGYAGLPKRSPRAGEPGKQIPCCLESSSAQPLHSPAKPTSNTDLEAAAGVASGLPEIWAGGRRVISQAPGTPHSIKRDVG